MPTYLGALFFGLPVWFILFYLRKDLRHKILIMSLFVAFVAPIDTFFIPGYWHPVTLGQLFGLPIDIFTLLFGFELGGIASVIYEEVMRKTYIRQQKKHSPLKFLIILGPLSLYILRGFTAFNFMTDVLIATILMVILIVYIRRDLLVDVLLSGVFFATVYTVLLSIYIFSFPEVLKAWNLINYPQLIIYNVPHYEIVWAFLSGAFLGPVYEFIHDYVVRREIIQKKKKTPRR